jgi:hypothetical protein
MVVVVVVSGTLYLCRASLGKVAMDEGGNKIFVAELWVCVCVCGVVEANVSRIALLKIFYATCTRFSALSLSLSHPLLPTLLFSRLC